MNRIAMIRAAVALAPALSQHANAAQSTVPTVPAEVVAMLDAHVGRWRSEGTITAGGVSTPAKATWSCEHAIGGVGVVCSWEHEWADGRVDHAIELVGYDPMRGGMAWMRLTDQGVVRITTPELRGQTIYYRWESTENGKALVGVNEVFAHPDADWTQRMTVDVDGRRTTDMQLTHHRLQ